MTLHRGVTAPKQLTSHPLFKFPPLPKTSRSLYSCQGPSTWLCIVSPMLETSPPSNWAPLDDSQYLPCGRCCVRLGIMVLNISVLALATETLRLLGKALDHCICAQKPTDRQNLTQAHPSVHGLFPESQKSSCGRRNSLSGSL